ncbi:hypothetical protein H2198_001312 [Neophaeococcomyces mojaviensis]|uniref:Uncharacterized protein n=1 Tax=Neophaeococcomyces mojaviensis TaxID=3383035 RepID=A0ACC3AI24_9EURO|nr:hypothetical protein H2198_001312 [Knufia sp. JES_112]
MFCTAFRGGILQRNVFQRPGHSLFAPSLRQYATAKSAKAGARISLPKPPSKPSSGGFSAPSAVRMPSSQDLNRIERLRKVDLVEKLYNSGTKQLYLAPPRLTIFRFQSYLIAAIITMMVLTYQKYNLLDPEEFTRRGLSKILYPAYLLIATVLGCLGGICIYRTRGLVHAINLVQQHGQVFLKITERSVIPFRKTSFLVRPYNLYLHRKFVEASSLPEYAFNPPAGQTTVISAVFNAFTRFFAQLWSATRLLVSSDGTMTIEINEDEAEKKKTALGFQLDVTGNFELHTNRDGQQDPVLWELGTFKDDTNGLRSPFSLFKR